MCVSVVLCSVCGGTCEYVNLTPECKMWTITNKHINDWENTPDTDIRRIWMKSLRKWLTKDEIDPSVLSAASETGEFEL